MEQTKWVDRKFAFDLSPGWMPFVLERLRGTSLRIKNITAAATDEQVSLQRNNSWSIKQHIGHLCDLEELHDGRIDDFKARKPVLRAADMKNEKTEKAGHNSKNLTNLITDFEKARNHFIDRLSALNDETQMFLSMHPRLQMMMRPVEMAYFTAEHDDFHIACIRKLTVS